MIISEKTNFKPVPKGVHNAVCVDIVDLPKQMTQWGEKDMMRIVWETDCLMENGKPFLAINRYSKTLGPKSNLRKHLKSWKGKDLEREELKKFECETLIGLPCQLIIAHEPTLDGGIFAKVSTILEANADNKLKPTGKYIRVKDRPNAPKNVKPQAEEEEDSDDLTFG